MEKNYNISSLLTAFVLLLSITTSFGDYSGCSEAPIELSDTENASVIIGGMFPVHYWDKKSKTYALNKPGLLWVEAMIFAVNEINNRTDYLPKTKLGYRIHDSCNDINIAIESALELTQGFVPYKDVNNSFICPCNYNIIKAVALVGDAASATSTNVAAVLSSSGTTQISYSATSTDLNAKQLYPTFLRTIAPDDLQADLIVDLIVYNNWTYINVIACDDDYGRVGFNEILPKLKKKNVCIFIQEIYDIKGDLSGNITKKLVQRLIMEKQANVIILWCQRPEALQFLRVAEQMRLHNKTFIATEAYGFSEEIYNLDPNVVRGMFGIIPMQVKYQPFETMLKSMTPDLVYKNPWINEYWKEKNCNTSNETACKNIDLSDLPKSKYVEVFHAVQSVAFGLHAYIESEKSFTIQPQKLFSYIKKVKFSGINNLSVSYDDDGNPRDAGYSITNLKSDNFSSSNSTWQVIGFWTNSSGKITFDSEKQISFAGGVLIPPVSSCREICKPGYYRHSFENSCCWQCVRCGKNSVQSKYGQSNCTICPDKKIQNTEKTLCVSPKQIFIKLNSEEGILLFIVSAIAILFVLYVVCIFYKYGETPIVKASNKNLSLLQLGSIIFMLMLPFLYFQAENTKYRCGGRLLYFVCFNSITISVTFTKADRLLRIFNNSKSGCLTKNSIVKTNKLQFMTVAGLTLLGIVIYAVSYFSFPIEVCDQKKIEQEEEAQHVCYCAGSYDSILFLAIGYVAVIALICGVYAFKARNLPETYNEARLTSFAMFIFLLSWLMFIPIYLSTEDRLRKLSVWCFMCFASTSCFAFIMYSPKLYFIFFKTEENTKDRFRAKIHQPRSTFNASTNEFEIHENINFQN